MLYLSNNLKEKKKNILNNDLAILPSYNNKVDMCFDLMLKL